MKNNNVFYFLALVSLQLLLGYFASELLQAEQLYTATLAESFTHKQIQTVLDFQSKWQWIGYALAPVLFAMHSSKIFLPVPILSATPHFISYTKFS